jgi:hypothetical protein
MLHCTEVSQQTVAMGLSRDIHDVCAMSVMPPVATGPLNRIAKLGWGLTNSTSAKSFPLSATTTQPGVHQ